MTTPARARSFVRFPYAARSRQISRFVSGVDPKSNLVRGRNIRVEQIIIIIIIIWAMDATALPDAIQLAWINRADLAFNCMYVHLTSPCGPLRYIYLDGDEILSAKITMSNQVIFECP
jgi:hypothetical protein